MLVEKQSKALKHVEFVNLGPGRALAVLVSQDGDVENRIIALPDSLPLASLNEASNYINARIAGLTLAEARGRIESEIEARRAQLDELTASVVTAGLATWSGTADDQKSLIVCGHSHLLEDVRAMEDLERVRLLFQDLDTKKDLMQLLGLAERAEGVRIFIGSENKSFSLSGSSLIVSPFEDTEHRIVGRARRDRPDAAQLCPHHPDGRLHGPPARPPCPLIFGWQRSISRTVPVSHSS